MAEGFARVYGSDVMVPSSAGLAHAGSVSRDTVRAMQEKNIDISKQFPKPIPYPSGDSFDLVINLSGHELPPQFTPVRHWAVEDPIGTDFDNYRTVRDQIEYLVMQLILELRRLQKQAGTG
jgi:protein-tyrosine-phosphatase